MNEKYWQRLRGLESRDIVQAWFNRLHGLQLNERRTREIISSAIQSREFFDNAASADFSVRPLLNFYGVSTLAKSLTLLLRRSGGEETLTAGHGVVTKEWSNVFSGGISAGLRKIGNLRISTTSGVFTDLVNATDNVSCIHVRSSGVDWRIPYSMLALNSEFTLDDIFSRLPDLREEYVLANGNGIFASPIADLQFSPSDGFRIRLSTKVAKPGPSQVSLDQVIESYRLAGYGIETQKDHVTLTATVQNESALPQLLHAHQNSFFNIPGVHLVRLFPNGQYCNELGVCFLVSYMLGMFCRYFPTHWTALASGEKGDANWPMICQANTWVEKSFPRLVSEFVSDKLAQSQMD